jgi:hypothetical protein
MDAYAIYLGTVALSISGGDAVMTDDGVLSRGVPRWGHSRNVARARNPIRIDIICPSSLRSQNDSNHCP